MSALSLGTMTFGGRGVFARTGNVDVTQARRLVDIAVETGVTTIDTADVYSEGVSEEILGEVLSGRRDEIVLATKARFPMGPGPNDAGSSRAHLLRACEASLRRLRTDHIDLYQIHEWDGVTPVEETAEVLDTLVRQGKVRYVGASNFSGWQLMKALAAADAHGYQRYVSHQIHYTLQARDAESELVPLAIDQGLGIMVWSPLAGGLLSGKYRRDRRPSEGRHLTDWDEPPVPDEEHLWRIVDTVVALGEARGVSPAQIAVAWLLRRPALTTVIVGARTEDQLRDTLAAADLELTDEELDRLEAVSRPPLRYPHWHQAGTAADRLGPADEAWLAPYLA
jgi:aryl-alcohol dehydrogenase-like predicted oxidoreductase